MSVLTDDQIATFHRDGFVIAKGLFAPDEIEPIRALTQDQLDTIQTHIRDGGGRTYKVGIWTNLDESLIGRLPRMPRIVDAVEALLETTCYHWHSKLLRKRPGDGAVGIHQDYATWYEDGCLYPHLLTCSIAIDRNDRDNGCVYFVPGSHKMARIHRVLLGDTIDTHGPDPARVEQALERLGMKYGELDPGDALFFHCKTLHGSHPNQSERSRTVIHCSFNAESNRPVLGSGQAHHRYRPLQRASDSFIREGGYDAVFYKDTFHRPETDDDAGAGIFYRPADKDVAREH